MMNARKGEKKEMTIIPAGVHGALRVLVTPAPCFALTRSDPPGRTGRRLDGGAGGGWQEQGFGVTASLTRSRGERPWEAMGTTSIARIGKESSTTTGTLIIIFIRPPSLRPGRITRITRSAWGANLRGVPR